MKKIVVFGNNNVAEIIHLETQKYNEEHFAIEAFCIDKEYRTGNTFCGKPLLDLDEAVETYPPGEYAMLSTILSSSGLRKKMLVYDRLKKLGYTMVKYISPLSNVFQNDVIGENNIVFPFCFIGLSAKIGNANIFWNGVNLDHNAIVGDGNFFASGCKTAGFVEIGNSCWLGLNSTIIQRMKIADETLVGAGAVVIGDTKPWTKYVGNPARAISEHKSTGVIGD
jgi:sugar O-acyltransferase (sialic acid O-acetyltransferase NeuD family)